MISVASPQKPLCTSRIPRHALANKSSSGGYAGFSASVSAGYSNSKSDTNKATMNVYKKTMIASYLVMTSLDVMLRVLNVRTVSTSGHHYTS